MDALRRNSILSNRSRKEPMDPSVGEDVVLHKLGYDQELKRNFGLLGMIGFSFSIVTCWTALGGVLTVGIESGGPPVMIYSWIAVCLLALCVGYSFAELCSSYPVAGGQYSWVYVLSPPSYARPLSFVTGWFMITGIVTMGAVNNFIGANFLLGMANLMTPSYGIERWHTVLVTYLIAIVAATVNIWLPKFFDKLSKAILCWNIFSFFVVIITMLATNDHKQSADFVWKNFQNYTGWGPAMATIVGLLQSFFGMCCYDTPAHMCEELHDASNSAPRAIVMSVWLGAGTGLVFLITSFYCIGSLEAAAGTSTGVPLIEIFLNSTGSQSGACVLAAMITVIVLVCANSLMAEGSRALWAFARDGGMPFSKTFAKVVKVKGLDDTTPIPLYSVLLCLVVQMALNSIYFGTVTGFNTVISIATEGFYLSYAMPLLVRLIHRYRAPVGQKDLHGPYKLGRYGAFLNATGLLFLVFASITFNFPSVRPITSENMNYCSAAIGVIALVAVVTWVLDGRKNFSGPAREVEPEVYDGKMDKVAVGDSQEGVNEASEEPKSGEPEKAL